MAKRRDKYGRFKGKGGIKPYKSNLKGSKRKSPGRAKVRRSGRYGELVLFVPVGPARKKKLSKKAKVGVAALYVSAAAFGAYSARPRHFR